MKKHLSTFAHATLVIFVFAFLALGLSAADEQKVTCPVTGKTLVKTDKTPSAQYKGNTYYFCCEGCKAKFEKEPAKFFKTVFTCSMHPEVKADKAGKCTKCGMNLEQKEVFAAAGCDKAKACDKAKTCGHDPKTCTKECCKDAKKECGDKKDEKKEEKKGGCPSAKACGASCSTPCSGKK